MGSLTDAAELLFLDHLTSASAAWTPSATVYLALYIGDPLDTGDGGAEVTAANGYARVAIPFATPPAAASRQIVQSGIVQYAGNTGSDWGTVTNWAIFDASTAGTMLAHGVLSASRSIVVGNTPSVASGQIIVSVTTGGASDYLVEAMLDFIFGAGTFAQPSLFVALASAALTDTSTGTTLVDLVMTDYARESKSAGLTDWDAASGTSPGATANKTLVNFGALTGTGETVEAIALCDAATVGNLLVYDNTVSQDVGTGDTVQMIVGAFDITLD